MKVTRILLLLSCLQVSAKGFGQGIVIISLKDMEVNEAFMQIEKQTTVQFIYNDELVKKASLMTIVVKDATEEEALDKCFAKKPLEYKIFKETIEVTGSVLNELGKPVEGATVTIKGTDKSAFTNSSGEFLFSSVEKDVVLVFTSEKMERFELKVSGKKKLVVRLKANVVAGKLSKRNNLIQIFSLIIISTSHLFQHFKLIARRKAGILYPRIFYINKL